MQSSFWSSLQIRFFWYHLNFFGAENVRIIDVSTPIAYGKCHLPAAMNMHNTFFAARILHSQGGIRTLIERTAEDLGSIGISNIDQIIIIAEDSLGTWGTAHRARLLLKAASHQAPVYIVEGGNKTLLEAASQTVNHQPIAELNKTSYVPLLNTDLFTDKTEILGLLRNNKQQTFFADFRGNNLREITALDWAPIEIIEEDKLILPDSFQGGRIPGSVILDHDIFFDENRNLKTKEQLEQILLDGGFAPDQRTICFCWKGLRASIIETVRERVGWPSRNIRIFFEGMNDLLRDPDAKPLLDSRILDLRDKKNLEIFHPLIREKVKRDFLTLSLSQHL